MKLWKFNEIDILILINPSMCYIKYIFEEKSKQLSYPLVMKNNEKEYEQDYNHKYIFFVCIVIY